MPIRKLPIVTNQIYHIYNRGVNHIPIFHRNRDYQRFIETIVYYQDSKRKLKFSHPQKTKNSKGRNEPKRVEIISYCLMPNHFHLLVKQLADNGIIKFIADLINSYSHYFNTKYDRSGPLFSGRFKAVMVETDQQLIHLSRYIHLNPVVSNIARSLEDHPWSSLEEYLETQQETVSSPKFVLDFFKSRQDYKEFIENQIDYAKSLESIKHQVLE